MQTVHGQVEPHLPTPWDGINPIKNFRDEGHCRWRNVALPGATPYVQCIRQFRDAVSDIISQTGIWKECQVLYEIWQRLSPSESDLFVDAGANIGACTLLMAAYGIKTVSFEPNPANLFYLTRSLLANPKLASHVTVYPVGLGETEASLNMYMEHSNAGNSVFNNPIEANKSVAVVAKVVPLRIFASTLPKVRLMKVDVQGFEGKRSC